MCSPIIGQCFDTMIVASSDKEWLQWPIEILVLETVLSHLKLRAVPDPCSFNTVNDGEAVIYNLLSSKIWPMEGNQNYMYY